ncbi:MAG: ABC transporter substrate-binding protein [Candidatus Ozemobacteraceae bacterium]
MNDNGNTARIGIGVFVNPENPEDSSVGNMIARHVLENLVQTGPGMEPLPMLAATWSVDISGKRWLFTLKPGIRFHDGTPCDADAVAFNFDPTRNPKFNVYKRRLGYLEPFSSVRAIARDVLEICTKNHFAPMLRHLSLSGGWIESPRALSTFPKKSFTGMVGTGPFLYKSSDKSEIRLQANPRYYDAPPFLNSLIFRTIQDERDRLLLLELGRLDAITGLPIFEIQRLQDEKSLIKVIDAPSLRVVAIKFNLSHAPISDVRVRHAISLAVDRPRIIQVVLDGHAEPAGSMFSPRTFGYASLTAPLFNPSESCRLLREAGLATPTQMTFRFRPGRYPMDQEVVETIAANLADIGIQLSFSSATPKEGYPIFPNQSEVNTSIGSAPVKASASVSREVPPKRENGPTSSYSAQNVSKEVANTDMVFTGWAPACGDGDWVLRPLFHSRSFPPFGANDSHYKNPEIDRLIDLGMTEMRVEERLEAYRRAQEILADDLPYAPLYASHQLVGLRPELDGVEILPQEYLSFRHAHRIPASAPMELPEEIDQP